MLRLCARDPGDLEVGRKPDALALAVSWSSDAKLCARTRPDLVDGNEVYAFRLGAVNRECIDLSRIVPPRLTRRGMMSIGACRREPHCPVSESARLALNSRQLGSVVEDEVVTAVLPKRNGYLQTGIHECEHDRKCRTVTDMLWVLGHNSSLVA